MKRLRESLTVMDVVQWVTLMLILALGAASHGSPS